MLVRKVVRLQRERKLIKEGSKILVGFSGGVDSVSLVHSLLELKDFLKYKEVALAHLNHQLRENSKRDEEFCKEFAKEKSLRIFVKREDIFKFARERGLNLEEAGRIKRYEFFSEVSRREGFDLIATAHHLTDLVETLIMRLLRGTSPSGLLSFRPKEGKIIRPLFLVKKSEIYQYAKEKNLKWVEDESNYDLNLVRNKIRHKILPIFEEINPNFEENFLKFWQILEKDEEFFDDFLEGLIKEISVGCCIRRREFLRLHTSIQRRFLKKFYKVKSFKVIEGIRGALLKGGEFHLKGRTLKAKGKFFC